MQVISGNFDRPRTVPPFPPRDFDGDFDGEVIALSHFQDCDERMLMCQACGENWVDIIPSTMPLHQLECDCCLQKGFVTGFVPRHLRPPPN